MPQANGYQWHEQPSDTTAVSLYNHLISLRDLALSAPLEQGMQFMLDLQGPPQNPHPRARKVPTMLCSGSATVVLQLNTTLQLGFDTTVAAAVIKFCHEIMHHPN
ncbi:hypothetical protein C8J57DRAFT_1542714 [Mycena rebaudengoi]|nr:hypothetical protein C8J57DRAFT_1542714 [Mycena rebaudengoi]